MKRMREIADVNATKTTGYATYFPYPETVEKVAYASGVYGWNASLYRGETSGLLYYVSDMGNDCGTNGHALREAFGYREREIVENLARLNDASLHLRRGQELRSLNLRRWPRLENHQLARARGLAPPPSASASARSPRRRRNPGRKETSMYYGLAISHELRTAFMYESNYASRESVYRNIDRAIEEVMNQPVTIGWGDFECHTASACEGMEERLQLMMHGAAMPAKGCAESIGIARRPGITIIAGSFSNQCWDPARIMQATPG